MESYYAFLPRNYSLFLIDMKDLGRKNAYLSQLSKARRAAQLPQNGEKAHKIKYSVR